MISEKTKSVSGKLWSQKFVNELAVAHMMQLQGYSELLSRLLVLKDIKPGDAPNFLNPKLRDFLPDPFHLKDMDKAVKRTLEAISKNQQICIFGDYDVDGATSSALLKRFFNDVNINVKVYIPDRIIEGYGPSTEAMRSIKNNGAALVITVDCGAMAFDALNAAKEIGLDVIVLDHHMGGEILPEAAAIVNPNRLDETTEFRYMAAVGVSFLFAVALKSKLQGNYNINLMNYLDIVALGTVCDMMPLVKLNRAFVSQGLKVMMMRQNIGLRTLADMARITTAPTCYHLGFIMGPMINAGGRVGRADLGTRLLSTFSLSEAENIALELEKFNEERREIEKNVLEKAVQIVEKDILANSDQSLVFVPGQGWHPGVIGIVASRLKEKYQKPVVVIAVNEGIGKASCRSVRGVDLGSKIVEAKLQGILVAGGGHAMAAGFTVLENKIDELKVFLNQVLAKEYKIFKENYLCEYDAEITTSGLTLDMVEEMHKLAPFGTGNYEPVLLINNLFILQAKIIGDKHVSCLLAPDKTAYGSKAFKAIAFNCMDSPLGKILMASEAQKISVFGHAQINEWQDKKNVQFVIQDLYLST